MALTADTGKLVFLEFKRKYPTKGGSRPKTPQDRPLNYSAFADEMLRAIRASSHQDPKENFKAECEKRNFRYFGIPSFGLDMRHFETMMLCDQMGIEYRYVIWNAGRTESQKAAPSPAGSAAHT